MQRIHLTWAKDTPFRRRARVVQDTPTPDPSPPTRVGGPINGYYSRVSRKRLQQATHWPLERLAQMPAALSHERPRPVRACQNRPSGPHRRLPKVSARSRKLRQESCCTAGCSPVTRSVGGCHAADAWRQSATSGEALGCIQWQSLHSFISLAMPNCVGCGWH